MSYPKDLDEYTDVELSAELLSRANRRSAGRCDYCDNYRNEGPCKFPQRHIMALTRDEYLER